MRPRVARADVYGGIAAAVIALPLALAFGVAALAPLGPSYAATGALAGLLGAILTGFFSAAFGGTPQQITGPTGPMTVVITAFIAEQARARGVAGADTVLVLAALAIVFGGVAQIAIGAAGGGRIIKYIPYPVVAGFMNGIAVIIFLGQLGPFLGVTAGLRSFDIRSGWVPMTVGTATIAAMIITGRVAKKIPASLVGLLAGVFTYLMMALAGQAPFRTANNPLVIGAIPNPLTSLEDLKRLLPVLKLGALSDIGPRDLQATLTAGLALGVLGSIDSLLTSLVADTSTGTRHDSKRELVGQGIGNLVSGLAGGLAGAGATVRTLVNIAAGGRTRHSGMVHAGVLLVVVALLGRPAGWIPLAALAGILFVTAVSMVDYYSLRLAGFRRIRHEFAVMVLVAAVTVMVDLMVAVALGLAFAAVLFVWQQARLSVIRRRLRGHEVTSRRIRSAAQASVLSEHGSRTLAYELSGALFFGTADELLSEVESDVATAERFVFDFSRVIDIDLSGVQILLSIVDRLRNERKHVAFSGLGKLERSRAGLGKLLADLGVIRRLGDDGVHETLDHALEHFEDQIIDEHGADTRASLHPLSLLEYEGFGALDNKDADRIAGLVTERVLEPGEVLFREGDSADALALVRRGRVSLLKSTSNGLLRVASLGRGQLAGVRAISHDRCYSFTVRADSASDVYLLDRAALDTLAKSAPVLMQHLERALLARALERIDFLTEEIVFLEER